MKCHFGKTGLGQHRICDNTGNFPPLFVLVIVFCLLFLPVLQTETAAQQAHAGKIISKLTKECERNASEFSQKEKLCDDAKGSYKYHYSRKLNLCFMYVFATCNNDPGNDKRFWRMKLIDVDTNKVYAEYTGPASTTLAPTICLVDGSKCKNAVEFQNMTDPYMNE